MGTISLSTTLLSFYKKYNQILCYKKKNKKRTLYMPNKKHNFKIAFVLKMHFLQAEIYATYSDVQMHLSTITLDVRVEMLFK